MDHKTPGRNARGGVQGRVEDSAKKSTIARNKTKIERQQNVRLQLMMEKGLSFPTWGARLHSKYILAGSRLCFILYPRYFRNNANPFFRLSFFENSCKFAKPFLIG